MKVIILAGGRGTRLGEETSVRPKPMVEIGGRPILWHIMNIYTRYGFKDFIVALGYKSEIIKEYFANFVLYNSDFSVNLKDGSTRFINTHDFDWNVTLVDTGLETMTGGRILRLKRWLDDEPFLATYGDGLGNVDIGRLVDFHRAHGKLATVTAVRPPARFGAMSFDGDSVATFSEKPQVGEGWTNGGFFVFNPGVLDYLENDQTILERRPLEQLASHNQLVAFRHHGFWQPMDTLREKNLLESLWATGNPPWTK